MATISFSNITSTSFEATISGLYKGTTKEIYAWLGNTQIYGGVFFSADYTTCGPFLFDELDPDTRYDITFEIYYPELGEWNYPETVYCTTLEGGGGGGTTEDEWFFSYGGSYTSINEETVLSCDLNEYEGVYVKISFASSGTATFETSGASDAYISLSSSKYYDSEFGIPDDEIVGDDNRRGDASFEYNVAAGTTYYLFICYYYEDSSGSFNVIITPPENSRPAYFEWDYDKVKGNVIKITAVEWNALQDNINEVRNWMGYNNYSFTRAVKGNDITAAMYNECISAINTIYSVSLTSYKVNAGDEITAGAINNLRDFINDVD